MFFFISFHFFSFLFLFPRQGQFLTDLFEHCGPGFIADLLRGLGTDFVASLFRELGTSFAAERVK